MCELSLSPRAIAVSDPRGALKLVVGENSGEILGGHMAGPDATAVIAQVVLAMETEVDFERLRLIFDVHPFMSEAIAQSLAASRPRPAPLGRDLRARLAWGERRCRRGEG
jgi:pyruvate/2-oxoglutarate dehydrogenase complex dihydrolipoamide dehydrogenase (E3) component